MYEQEENYQDFEVRLLDATLTNDIRMHVNKQKGYTVHTQLQRNGRGHHQPFLMEKQKQEKANPYITQDVKDRPNLVCK